MLFDFITTHREELIARTRAKVAKRSAPKATERELMSGVPLFLDQLIQTLRLPSSSRSETIERSAALHGAALLSAGYTVAQVVHDYGDICQAITELTDEVRASITTEEFHTLNRCLDNAIAGAVTEYSRLRERTIAASETERSGVFAHELRNRLSAAQLAFLAIKSGRAPIAGSVAAVVSRNLQGMTALIDRALVEVRLDSGSASRQRVHLFQLIEEAEVDGAMEAGVHGVSLTVAPTDRAIDVDADPQILAGAVANLLQNAFKFTHAGGQVTLKTTAVNGHVEIEIEDECGGLPVGKAEELFDAFKQRGANRVGLGLGLFISRKGVEANGGLIRVRDIPGRGCAFTIELPMMQLLS
jgi:signal transduction histidine kinase